MNALQDILTVDQIAGLAGVTQSTVKSLRARSYLPAPDGRIGRQDVWHVSTVTRWLVSRPGHGHPLGEVPQGDATAKAACEGWVTIPEIAAKLGLTTQGVRDRIKRGDFPEAAGKVGKSWVWKKSDFDQYLPG